MSKIKLTKEKVKNFIIMNLGAAMVACGFFFFKEPNHFTMGGIAGLAIIINGLVPNLSVGTFIMIINGLLLLLGFVFLGKKMGVETIYCSLAYSALIWVLDYFVTISGPLTGDLFVDLCFGVILASTGSALLFNVSATTGGTDIISMILKKYTALNISVCMLITDSAIALGVGFVYGWKVAAYSLLGLIIQVTVVKVVVENLNIKKEVAIITSKPHEICDYINNKLRRGATFVNATGAYTGENKFIVYAILSNYQTIEIKKAIKAIDEHSFMIITNATDIVGNGFRRSVFDFADAKDKFPHIERRHKEKPNEPRDEDETPRGME